MILPASALSSGASSQEFSSRSSFSAILSPTASDVEMSSLTTGPIRSEPSSPRRRTMPPPHSTPSSTSTASLRSSRLQARKGSSSTSAVQSSGSDNITSGTGESSSKTAGSRRRASSNSKQVDQQTRDLMRKVSHSAIERRRRERINDKILQLKHLVPACVDEDHLHKLSILQSTIEYIQHLKAIVPATVANAKIGKATNNNPNNKTTDMLEAMGGSISAKSPLTPLMTTGLSHIYAKGIKVEKRDIRELLEDHSQSLSLSVSSSSSSSSSSPSDDDAKDGLLLLATQSSAISPSSQAKRFQEGMRRNSREREDEDSEGDDC
ncbi:hypothetical protein BGZ98_010445 [Dissophora globulifera]|nr:hypothetical protein BGZ98_010445 [Dissophora globulifera]